MTRMILTAAFAFAAITGGVAMAQDVPTQSISTADLNLSSAAGIATLNSRVDAAVRQVCGEKTDVRALSTVMSIDACRAKATADAKTQVATMLAAAQPSKKLQLASR